VYSVAQRIRTRARAHEANVDRLRSGTHSVLHRYLPISAPFHSAHLLSDAIPSIIADAQRLELALPSAADLCVPVYSTADGTDLRTSSDLTLTLLQLQATPTGRPARLPPSADESAAKAWPLVGLRLRRRSTFRL
jgi:hypothetical protein